MQNLGTKGAWPRSRDLLLNFGTPSISGMAKARNVKFGVQNDYKGSTKNAKLRDKRGVA